MAMIFHVSSKLIMLMCGCVGLLLTALPLIGQSSETTFIHKSRYGITIALKNYWQPVEQVDKSVADEFNAKNPGEHFVKKGPKVAGYEGSFAILKRQARIPTSLDAMCASIRDAAKRKGSSVVTCMNFPFREHRGVYVLQEIKGGNKSAGYYLELDANTVILFMLQAQGVFFDNLRNDIEASFKSVVFD